MLSKASYSTLYIYLVTGTMRLLIIFCKGNALYWSKWIAGVNQIADWLRPYPVAGETAVFNTLFYLSLLKV